jgi:hypothetical protein
MRRHGRTLRRNKIRGLNRYVPTLSANNADTYVIKSSSNGAVVVDSDFVMKHSNSDYIIQVKTGSLKVSKAPTKKAVATVSFDLSNVRL